MVRGSNCTKQGLLNIFVGAAMECVLEIGEVSKASPGYEAVKYSECIKCNGYYFMDSNGRTRVDF